MNEVYDEDIKCMTKEQLQKELQATRFQRENEAHANETLNSACNKYMDKIDLLKDTLKSLIDRL